MSDLALFMLGGDAPFMVGKPTAAIKGAGTAHSERGGQYASGQSISPTMP